ncbi:Uma2 family endonuclease [Rugamonas sp. DEMB1]|uniref:Uma2 family endonuclease n=1 Tax=Rugamonas sp. DEMB1 TaxID=3039386 RepID=UPI00244C9DA1|nr:Uma2 family endonuclease [Rugamonas sp. DEMB1]WGG48464.1 Uma2 family endonuclease [Rugamonas sp. DEMB1]
MHTCIEKPEPLSPAALSALWEELGLDPNSPDFYELSEYGELIVSPLPHNRHQSVVAWVIQQLLEQLGGRAYPNLAISTRAGVRVPDVAWLPEERWAEALNTRTMSSCPPLVVEVLSPGNRHKAIGVKIGAYLAAGATEVVLIDLNGAVYYHRRDGEFAESSLKLRLDPPAELFR